MKRWKISLISLAITVAVWLVFSWPLPRYFHSGIASSAYNAEKYNVRAMIPGDQLQLLYFFWLVGDMVRGHTPFFHNLYEFNSGDDGARVERYPYYAPFSLIYMAFEPLGGRAFGWNCTGLFTLWLTYFLTWLLARRYVHSEWIAGSAALIGIIFPFRWLNLLGGSPMGFAMLWAPTLLLGLDVAVRDRRFSGGLLAGLGILFASWTDSHMFFFSMLATPCWCVLAILADARFNWRRVGDYLRLALALLPCAVLALTAVYFAGRSKAAVAESGNVAAAGRAWNEVALFSPTWRGFFSFSELSIQTHVFLGFGIAALVIGGLLVLAVLWFRNLSGFKAEWRKLAVLGLLCVGIAGALCLALGPFGPFEGRLFLAVRKLIPPYAMIRQPAKIFCYLPTLLSVFVAVMFSLYGVVVSLRRLRLVVPVLMALLAMEFAARTSATVCLLDHDQAAYGAVSRDAAGRRVAPRAIVLPIWPGDTHYTSLYQYYVSLYRIRMINGYMPIVSRKYLNDVFWRFEPLNRGIVADDLLDDLQGKGIDYILLHENLFPENVSPFPVQFTLNRLLNHPRLTLVKHADTVWAFRILGKDEPRPENWTGTPCESLFCARRWEAEGYLAEPGMIAQEDPEAGGGKYYRLAGPGNWVSTTTTRVTLAPDARWMIRVRGHGTMAVIARSGETNLDETIVRASSSAWTWQPVPIRGITETEPVALRLEWRSGAVHLDVVQFTAGPWVPLAPDETREIPAPCFFHAGFTDPERNTVVFQKDREPVSALLYGPKLPLEPGPYEIEIVYTSVSPDGVPLGKFNLHRKDDEDARWVPVISGLKAKAIYNVEYNLPANLVFVFERNGDMEIKSVIFKRLR